MNKVVGLIVFLLCFLVFLHGETYSVPPRIEEMDTKTLHCALERRGDERQNQAVMFVTVISGKYLTGEEWQDYRVFIIPPNASVKAQRDLAEKASIACLRWIWHIEDAKEKAREP